MLANPSGLLGSGLTWEEVRKTIELQSANKLTITTRTSITPFAEGVGLQSLLGVVKADFQAKRKLSEGETTPDWPDEFILKIGSPVALLKALAAQASKIPEKYAQQMATELVKFMVPCHNAEVVFYNRINNLKYKIEELPHCYFTKAIEGDITESKGFIGMELIKNAHSLTPAQNFSDDQIKQVLKTLVKLEKAFLVVPEDVKNSIPHKGLEGLYATIQDWFLELNNGIMAQVPHPKMAQLTKRFAEILPEIISAKDCDQLAEKTGMKKVLVHGDLWAGNILWSDDGKLKKIVDFQMIHYGLAATDLTRLFNTCLSPETRREKLETYLKFYHECLVENSKDLLRICTFKQLYASYMTIYPRTATYLLPALTAVLEKVMHLPDGEMKQMALGSVIGKVVGIYEDIIAIHEENHK